MPFLKALAAALVIAVLGVSTPVAAANLTLGLASEPTSIDPHFHNSGVNSAFV